MFCSNYCHGMSNLYKNHRGLSVLMMFTWSKRCLIYLLVVVRSSWMGHMLIKCPCARNSITCCYSDQSFCIPSTIYFIVLRLKQNLYLVSGWFWCETIEGGFFLLLLFLWRKEKVQNLFSCSTYQNIYQHAG